jgi:hypothetical protein
VNIPEEMQDEYLKARSICVNYMEDGTYSIVVAGGEVLASGYQTRDEACLAEARVMVERILQAGGFTEERVARLVDHPTKDGQLVQRGEKRLVGPWREVVSDGE